MIENQGSIVFNNVFQKKAVHRRKGREKRQVSFDLQKKPAGEKGSP